jgi:trk system potassium uptake protein
MIRLAALAHILGNFLIVVAGTMLVPLVYAIAAATGDVRPLLMAFTITFCIGAAMYYGFPKPEQDLSNREGLLMVAGIWFGVAFFGSLPFFFSPHFASFTDAFFESTSGFTTTGATILGDVEVLSGGIQLWRHLSHWLGGMGIVVLGIAILPLLSAGGMHLYRAEFSGAKSEKLKPRITETAFALWRIYVAFTVAEYVALRLAGMGSYDAVCHSLSTLGTGGFSTRTASVAGFESPAIEYIICFFMLLAGVNFTRHYRLFVERAPRSFFGDVEVRAYFAIVAAATFIVMASLITQQQFPIGEAFRQSIFQVAAIITTTGFVTADFERWPFLPQMLLFGLMFVGGCTGSTSGGLKVSRMVLLFRVVGRELHRMVERRGVFSVRLGNQIIPENTIQNLLNLLYLAALIYLASALILTACGSDLLTSISAVAASMFNIGPGLGEVGPADNYGHLPGLSKWVLCVCMIAGRLEFYTLIVIFTPFFWRK